MHRSIVSGLKKTEVRLPPPPSHSGIFTSLGQHTLEQTALTASMFCYNDKLQSDLSSLNAEQLDIALQQ